MREGVVESGRGRIGRDYMHLYLFRYVSKGKLGMIREISGTTGQPNPRNH